MTQAAAQPEPLMAQPTSKLRSARAFAVHRIVSRHRVTILSALYLAAKYEDSLEDAWRGADAKCAYKSRRAAAKYRRLRQKLVSANGLDQGRRASDSKTP